MYAELARKCKICKKIKLNKFFHLNGYRRKDGSSAPRSECKNCSNEVHYEYLANEEKKNRVNARRRECYKKNINGFQDKIYKQGLKRRYNLSYEDYQKILSGQKNKCFMCKVDQKDSSYRFNVDHCHKTGKIRALLCHNCNRGLGLLKDDIDVLKSGIKLLRRARSRG